MEEGKLKDYTKYDFSAIVGAEVEIRRQDLNTFKGTLVMSDEQLISVMIDDIGVIHYELKENILSLTAKIKVEDMNVKQMMEFCFIDGDCNYAVLYNDKTCVATCGKHAKNIELKDYIDCTDWGWKK